MSDVAAVFQIGSLGDSIVSVPALLSVRELIPCSEYILITRSESMLKVSPSDVFSMAWKPAAVMSYTRANPSRITEAASIASVIAQLRFHRPRYCVYLMPSERSERQIERDRLFFRTGGVKELIGFRRLTTNELRTPPVRDYRVTEAYLRIRRIWNDAADEKFKTYSSTPLFSPGEQAISRVKQWLSVNRHYRDRRLVTICPYSNYRSKDIPHDVLVNLLPRLHSQGMEVILLGGQKDVGRAQSVVEQCASGTNACGIFSVEESAALLRVSNLVIASDSGPMHLAAAVGTPAIVVFSRISKELGQWFPLGQQHTILYREPPCAGCQRTSCPIESHPCMRGVTADHILSAALNRLSGLPIATGALDGTKALLW